VTKLVTFYLFTTTSLKIEPPLSAKSVEENSPIISTQSKTKKDANGTNTMTKVQSDSDTRNSTTYDILNP